MEMLDLIVKRRDGQPQVAAEFEYLSKGAAAGTIPDYQLSAWLMAAFLNPFDLSQTAMLTVAMANSGERLDLTGLPRPWVDKHSTGGVGDKTTIVLLPLLAACGLTVVKMSGRGLGITGGTIDKLESIPGMNVDLDPERMKGQALDIGLALTGQTPRLAPADGVLYALRDVTGTIPNLPLIVSSILSKKLAGGAEYVGLDVKCGSGGFMPDPKHATQLASALEQVGQQIGLNVHCQITDMDQPLGRMAGNALEIKEAIRTLQNKPFSPRFHDLCIELAASTLLATGLDTTMAGGRAQASSALVEGRALHKAQEWVIAQGGDDLIFQTEDWQVAAIQQDVLWDDAAGWVQRVDAGQVGQTVVDLGGGRKKKTDAINPTVGVETLIEVGDKIAPGQLIFRVHAASHDGAIEAIRKLRAAVQTSPNPVAPRPVVMDERSS